MLHLSQPTVRAQEHVQAWAQCLWCEKWRRVPVLLQSSDRFHCADCTLKEDPLAMGEQVLQKADRDTQQDCS